MAETTSQAKKLGLKDGARLAVDGAPAEWDLADAPAGLLRTSLDEEFDVAIAFVVSQADLASRIDDLGRRITPGASLWLAWPRRAGGHSSDLTDVIVRDAALARGLVDSKVAAIDADWSGLRFTRRR
jgi:hypothetical protein